MVWLLHESNYTSKCIYIYNILGCWCRSKFPPPPPLKKNIPTIPLAWETDLVANPEYSRRRNIGSIRIFTWLACVVAPPSPPLQLRHPVVDAIDSHVLLRRFLFSIPYTVRGVYYRHPHDGGHFRNVQPPQVGRVALPLWRPPSLRGLTNIARWHIIASRFWKNGVTITLRSRRNIP